MKTSAEVSHIPLFDLRSMHESLRMDLVRAFERVLESGRFSSGEEVESFESALAERVGTRHAVAVASGTAALHLTLRAAGVGPGDEVVLPANTFFATAEAVFAAGATPVFADVDPTSALVHANSIEAVITSRTAAVIAVHLYGQPANMEEIRRTTDRHGLFLLEDAAQALGAAWNGRAVGSLADAAAFSFYPTKNLGALGEGGAVTTDDSALADRVAILRDHGQATKNVHIEIGFNERLDELQGAFLAIKLGRLDEELRQRQSLVDLYSELFREQNGVERVASASSEAQPAHHLLVVKVPHRDHVLNALREAGIAAAVHYPTPIHLQPACRDLGVEQGALPNAENLARSILSLPLHVALDNEDVRRCVSSVYNALSMVGA